MTVGMVFSQPYARSLLGSTFASRTLFGVLVELRRCSGSKKLRSTCSGNNHPVGEPCLWLTESKESSPVDEVEIKIKMDDGVVTSLASEGVDLSIC